MHEALTERDWRDLLRLIHGRQVVPVVGPDLATVPDATTGAHVPVRRLLAPALASELGLADPESYHSWNDVARAHLREGGDRWAIYDELRALLEKLAPEPPAALVELAGIVDFDLFISSTPDRLLSQALARQRPGFLPERHVIRFHPSAGAAGDLPKSFEGPLLLHILGDVDTYPDFAVWEEDYLEFVCGLMENTGTLENLFRVLRNRHLLFLGTPGEDWIVRFFLRVARQERLSESHHRDYLADSRGSLGEPLILFFDTAVKATRVIDGSPAEFVGELARNWRSRYGAAVSDEEFLQRMPDELVQGAVFLSYSRDDLGAAVKLARALEGGGVRVWMDKLRLQAGADYERNLEGAVKEASFFVSLVSKATEADAGRFVHRERAWAAERQPDGLVFYVPLALDLEPDAVPRLEPERFRKIHHERWSDATLGNFVRRMRQLVDELASSGRPRG
jgi:hypothetical protein